MKLPSVLRLALLAAAALVAACAETPSTSVNLYLNGANEVPPVSTKATGTGTIVINPDLTLSGSIRTTGVAGTVAHIHQGMAGSNGPVIVPLEKDGDGGWKVPAGAKLTPEQFQTFKSGGLYVNVHSVANKGGEIRDQLRP